MKLIDLPVIGNYFMKKVSPKECYIFWEKYCKGFRQPCKDLTEKDVTLNSKSKIKKVMEKILTKKRNQLLIKITGWPRIRYLKEIL